MEQHPIPRQITTFEFKLIGFMTLKQFLYLAVFAPTAYIVYRIVPIPLINILLGFCVAGFGVALAFVPIQDRPLDVFLKHFLKRLRSPTQYTYERENQPLYFLKDLYFTADPHRVVAHVESQKKLASYLTQTQKPTAPKGPQIAEVTNIVEKTSQEADQKEVAKAVDAASSPTAPVEAKPKYDLKKMEAPYSLKQPFFSGVVKNNKQIPLPGVLIYVKDDEGTVVRLLKTNPHGVFASYSPLPAGSYNIEIKDPNGGYFFDTMKVRIETENPTPFMFYSKELL